MPIQEQPLLVLRLLLDAEGRVVTREELRCALWPEDTFVDFEHGVNTAVKKLRQALEDSAENPRFIETIPKVGYRFLLPVDWVAEAGHKGPQPKVVSIGSPGPIPVPPLPLRKNVAHREQWRWLVVALAVGLLLAAVGGYVLRRDRLQAEKLTVVPFTTFPGFEIAPSFSPDGNQIVFSWFGYEKEYQFDLYIKQVGEERVFQLTHHPAIFLAAAWSPNGRAIGFMRQAEPESTGIYTISALGGAERKLTDFAPYTGGWDPIALSWSADSKWLAFPKSRVFTRIEDPAPDHFTIHMVNVETAEERVMPNPSSDCANMWQPAFSPDGKSLASVCMLTEGVARIYVQSLDGKQAREVTDARSSAGFSGLAWARDSKSLLYSSDRNLWRVPVSGGKPEKLLFAQDVESVSVARSGNRLAYAQVRHPSTIWQLELAGPTKAAGPATKIISSSRGDGGPHISPDGKFVAFQSWRSGSHEIWVCDRDASNPVQLTSFGGPQVGAPNWSPDSRKIVFDLRASGNPELYTVNVGGGPPKRLVTGTPNASDPFWSADGHAIYFSTEPPDAIWKVPVEGGTAIRLTGEGKGRMWPMEAVDGRRVFFSRDDGVRRTAWSVSVNGGDEHPIAGMPSDVPWVPARRGAYFINGSPRHFFLNHFDFASRQIQKVADLPGLFNIWGNSLSPDGRTFLFAGIEHSEGDIVMVEGFR